MILVDTSVWIDFLDGTNNKETDYLVEALEAEMPIFYTGIILQEVMQGLLNKKQQEIIKGEFGKLLLITPTIEDHILGASIFTKCRSAGFTVRKTADCLIASLALQYNLRLLDRDKDYEYISKVFPLHRFE
jgi:predicted nucleic acid-binding protein